MTDGVREIFFRLFFFLIAPFSSKLMTEVHWPSRLKKKDRIEEPRAFASSDIDNDYGSLFFLLDHRTAAAIVPANGCGFVRVTLR